MPLRGKMRRLSHVALNRAPLHSGVEQLSLLLFLSCLLAVSAQAQPQSDTAARPYATLDRQSVTYRGPIPKAESEPSDGSAAIGVILPLNGPQQADGKAMLAAAQLAMKEEQALGPLPDGRQLKLAVRDESGPWGQASVEILKLFQDDQALAILTSANGASAHLAEQIANKISIPILTLASDPTTTEANVPWLFRLGASDSDQARSFCQRLYSDLRLHKVLLIAQADHDGRIGSEEFEKAAQALKAPPPLHFESMDSAPKLESLRTFLQTNQPEAIVVWTDASLADQLIPLIRSVQPSVPIFLCRKAAQLTAIESATSQSNDRSSGGLFTVSGRDSLEKFTQDKFQQRYLAQVGTRPGFAAGEMYDAVHLLAAALRATGASRVLLRDYLANENTPRNTSAKMPFDPAGNSLQEFTLVRIQPTAPAKP